MKVQIFALSTVTAFLIGSASAIAQSTAPTRPIQEDERAILFPSGQMIEVGRSVAADNCAKCHGMDGISTAEDLPNLAGQRAIYLYRILTAYQSGDRKNGAMGHVSRFLNDEAIRSISVYYASLTPARVPTEGGAAEVPQSLEDSPFAGIRTAIKKCNKCHGESGNSSASGMPNLTAQDPEYFGTSMKAYIDGSRNHKMMKKLVGNLEDQTIREMGVYYAVQSPQASQTRGDGDVDSGRSLSEPCGNCHGVDGNAGSGNMPSLAGQDARYFVKAMKQYLDGERKHEPMYDAVNALSASDIQDLATFYAGQEPRPRNVRVPFTPAEWIERCERCHGVNGNSTDPRFPMLAGQRKSYLKKAMKAYVGNERAGYVMHAMSDPLSQSDIERIVSYYASQEPKSVVYLQLPCE